MCFRSDEDSSGALNGVCWPGFCYYPREAVAEYKHWFDPAVKEAGIKEFVWYLSSIHIRKPPSENGVDFRTLAELMGHEKRKSSLCNFELSVSD